MAKVNDKETSTTKEEAQSSSENDAAAQANPQDTSASLKVAAETGIQEQQPTVVPQHQVQTAKADDDPPQEATAKPEEHDATKVNTAQKPDAGEKNDLSKPQEPESATDAMSSDAKPEVEAQPHVKPDQEAVSEGPVASDSVPHAPDSVRDIEENESLDVMDLASDDAGRTEPTRSAADSEPAPPQETPVKEVAVEGVQPEAQASEKLAELNTDQPTQGTVEEAEDAVIPVVEPSIAGDTVLPESNIAEPEVAKTGEQRGNETPDAGGFFDDSATSLPGGVDVGLDSKLPDGVDPVGVPGSDEATATPPMAGPISVAEIAGADQTTNIHDIGLADAPGPVADSSGIESGNATTTVTENPDGSKHHVVVIEQEDGSERIIHVSDESIITIETTPDGWTKTVTQVNTDGTTSTATENGTTKTTVHPDGSWVTEEKTADGTVTETHSDGTVIIYHPDGKTEVIEPEDKKAAGENGDDEQTEQSEDAGPGDDDATGAEDDSKAVDASASAGRPVDDGLTDEDKVNALHEAEFAFQEAVKAGSLINPVREDIAGIPEGGGNPPPGVDDPLEDEAPPPDELPEEDPVSAGISGGNIDFGPDHVENQDSNTSNSRLTEERGIETDETGQTEADATVLDTPLNFDPEAIQAAVEDVQQSMTGVDADAVLTFSAPRFEAAPVDVFSEAENLSDEVASVAEITQEHLQPMTLFELHETLESFFSDQDSENHATGNDDLTEDGGDLG